MPDALERVLTDEEDIEAYTDEREKMRSALTPDGGINFGDVVSSYAETMQPVWNAIAGPRVQPRTEEPGISLADIGGGFTDTLGSIGRGASAFGRALDRGLGKVLGFQVPGTGSMAPTPEEEAETQAKLSESALYMSDVADNILDPEEDR